MKEILLAIPAIIGPYYPALFPSISFNLIFKFGEISVHCIAPPEMLAILLVKLLSESMIKSHLLLSHE